MESITSLIMSNAVMCDILYDMVGQGAPLLVPVQVTYSRLFWKNLFRVSLLGLSP